MVFLVECKPDEIIVRTLTSTPRKNIVHSGDKPGVIIDLTKRYENLKGVIDEDPGSSQPRLLQRFHEVESLEEHYLKVLYKDRNNYLIVLRPRLENWVLKAAKESSVDVEAYGSPNDALELHAEINAQPDGFKELVENLKRSKRLTQLTKILKRSRPF